MEIHPIDPEIYSQYCTNYITFQQAGANDFLLRCASKSDWAGLVHRRVADIGCGPGTSPQWILEIFPLLGEVLAVDKYQQTVELAPKHRTHTSIMDEDPDKRAEIINDPSWVPDPRIHYYVGDISNRAMFVGWEGAIEKVISTWCLQYLKDQKQALANIRFLLQPEGEAAVMFLLHSTHYDAMCEVAQNLKWIPYLEDVPENYVPKSHKEKLDASHYKEILEEVGFSVLLCEQVNREHKFNTENECREFLASQCTVIHRLPPEMRANFFQDFMNSFVSKNPRYLKTPDQRIIYRYTYLIALVKKS